MNLFQGIIDIYDGNDRIDLKDAWNRRVRAILHQTSCGAFKKDKLYKERKQRALDMGFLWAGYHLLSPEDVGTQLDMFLTMEDGHDPRVGMAIDWEEIPRRGTASGDQVRDFVRRFNQAMKPR
jgi:GH25 family lysozyme M1 (1,4-beta-N-acetylmuramidase)